MFLYNIFIIDRKCKSNLFDRIQNNCNKYELLMAKAALNRHDTGVDSIEYTVLPV